MAVQVIDELLEKFFGNNYRVQKNSKEVGFFSVLYK